MLRPQSQYQLIKIHPQAPVKPQIGKTCNGCGVCCAAELCPVNYVLLWPHQHPCRALVWSENRYYCGLVINPSAYLKWLPKRMQSVAIRLFKRWIAANQQCDSEVEWVDDTETVI